MVIVEPVALYPITVICELVVLQVATCIGVGNVAGGNCGLPASNHVLLSVDHCITAKTAVPCGLVIVWVAVLDEPSPAAGTVKLPINLSGNSLSISKAVEKAIFCMLFSWLMKTPSKHQPQP